MKSMTNPIDRKAIEDSARAATPKSFNLEIIKFDGRIHCAYLNNYRVAGGKPWGGGETVKSWTITIKDIEGALPEIAAERRALTARIAALEEFAGWVVGQMHNLPRSATADAVEAKARALQTGEAGA